MGTKFNYTNLTLKFSIAGFFLVALPISIALGFQMLLGRLEVECSNAWAIIWTISWIGMFVAPIAFARKIRKKGLTGFHLTEREVTLFNIVEYSFIQWSLASTITSGKTLCYVTDGQNGLEFVFTGWMAIPVLIVLSLFFDFVRRKTQDDFVSMQEAENS